ncbi:glycoside hydrolase family 31 protein, partial [Aureobasidium melanogenum]
MFAKQDNRLIFSYDADKLWIEPWGKNALRIRATQLNQMPSENWALEGSSGPSAVIEIGEKASSLSNGDIKAVVTAKGKLTVYGHGGKVILDEAVRNRRDVLDPKCSAIDREAREFQAIPATNDYHIVWRLESLDKDEKIYGMGQYQQPYLDLKGLDLELAHRNSQASVPFAVSSLGYGLLWNNPGIGRAVFGKNIMSFEAMSSTVLDCWLVAGETPAEIVQAYAGVTGTVPMMPEYGLGFWQCKLRYQTQEELLDVAREYKARQLPIDLIVIDFFHWPLQGEWKFDPTYWPDPDAMVRELKEMNIELMVSIWPTVDRRSENYQEMVEKGLLIRCDRGTRISLDFEGNTVHFDATNPQSRAYVWSKAKQNYYSKGIKTFWLDEAEPEYSIYHFDNWRYWRGSNVSIGNIYPREYARAFYEGQEAEGQKNIVNLLRCAWAGSQKYGALVWSGDIASSWYSMKNQFAAGLNMGMAGISWWTTDIGGFHGGNPDDEAFRELFTRWFQYGTFCPVMRLHGDREPHQPQHGTTGGATCLSGAPNEVWSYGPEVLEICKKYMKIREGMREYTRNLMKEAHETGSPIIRPIFYDFPEDKKAWSIEDQQMYGPKYLVSPIFNPGQRKRTVYLPSGAFWEAFEGGEVYNGGREIEVDCPIDMMPVFIKQ